MTCSVDRQQPVNKKGRTSKVTTQSSWLCVRLFPVSFIAGGNHRRSVGQGMESDGQSVAKTHSTGVSSGKGGD